MKSLDLALVGFGNVGRRFVRLLEEQSRCLHRDHDLDWRVVGIATRRHGTVRNPGGINAVHAAEMVEAGTSLDTLQGPAAARPHVGGTEAHATGDAVEARATGDAADSRATGDAVGPASLPAVRFIDACADESERRGRPLVVVETTVLDVRTGQPATDHVRGALRAGAHVVTANKGPVAFAYAELAELAASVNRSFLFEGAVMDGIPIFNLARETLPAVGITGFRGVVNSTTNFIITAMENGRDFEESLAEMQAAGIAEADASLDVDGWDAAAKTAALANVLMNARLTPHGVARTGIGGLTGEGVRAAAAQGRRIKLVSRAECRDGGVRASVAPEEVPEHDLLATLRDQQNALILQTDLLGDFSIVQLGGGLTQTAYALVSDLVAVRKRM